MAARSDDRGDLPMSDTKTVASVMMQSKSMGLALILTILFGPLGLLYVSILWGIVMTLLAAVLGFLTFGIAAGAIWLISIVWAAIAVKRHNERLLASL
jgi:hypothetical protein